MLKEFKEFAMRGNVLDMAIGIILGTAFGKIVSSMVQDVLMPPIGLLLGKVDFSSLFINLSGQPVDSLDAAQKAGLATLRYGMFVNNLINFIIVAWVIFLFVKGINQLLRKPEPKPSPAAPTSKDCPYCLSAIPLKATRCAHCTSEVK